jgi:peptidoglycan/LPS O-acetylase OafA/YrhL
MLCGIWGLTRPTFFSLILCLAIALILLVPQTEGGGLAHAASTLSFPFALGAAAYVYRKYVPISGLLALVLLGLAALCRWTPAYPILHALAISYGALWFGFANIPGLRAYNRLGDYSYGMYIYAFPVEQVIATTLHPASPWVMIAIGFPITLAFAAASWTWVEDPALANRHVLAAQWRLRRLRLGRTAPAATG